MSSLLVALDSRKAAVDQLCPQKQAFLQSARFMVRESGDMGKIRATAKCVKIMALFRWFQI